MPAVWDGAAPATESPFDRALATIGDELGIVFPSTERVEAACAELRRHGGRWMRDEHVAGVRRLLPLVHARLGPFRQPLIALLREVAVAAASWPILEGLLASRDPELCSRSLDDAVLLSDTGAMTIDLSIAQALADLSEREGSPLCRPDLLAKIANLLQHLAPSETGRGDAVATLYVGAARASLRRLAARVLDLPGNLPSSEMVASVLGAAASRMMPFLTYTRASHLDVGELVRRPGATPEIAESLCALDRGYGRTFAGDVVGELGWRRANLGLDLRRYVGVSVDGSLPFLLTPVEANLAGTCQGARRVFERIVAIGHGGTRAEADAGTGGDEAVARFRAYNLEHAEVLSEILDVAPLTLPRVHAILGRMDRITQDFIELFASRSDECAALPEVYGRLKARIANELRGAIPGRPLSVELGRLVQMFEDPRSLRGVQTLHGLKRYLHQRGLALGFGLLESRHGTNRTVDLVVASTGKVLRTVRRVEYVDFDPRDPPDGGTPVIPYAVMVVADGFARQLLHGQSSLPHVRVFCYGNEVHYFASFRNHPVFIRVDYSPPLSGGMIDLAYYGVSKYELDAHPAVGLEGIQECFKRLDFDVQVENTRIHARYDKERARDLTDLCDKAEALFRLVPYLMDVDWTIGSLDLAEEARRAVGGAWADIFARWGALPVQQLLTDDRTGILIGLEQRPDGPRQVRWSGSGPYSDVTSGKPRPAFFAELHEAMAARGVEAPLVEGQDELGQMALEKRLLRPLRAALARGELLAAGDAVHRAPPTVFDPQHEADRLAWILKSDAETIGRSARLARLAAALERTLRFETTSTINGYEVQRATLALRGQTAALYALRDGRGIFRLALFAPDGAVYRHRTHPSQPWHDSVTCEVGEVAPLLRRNNFLPSWIDVAARDDSLEAHDLHAMFMVPNARSRTRPLAGERTVAGVTASPGRAVGLARLGTRGRHPDDLRGGVLFVATMSPDDNVFLYHAAAVVATGGGILSHAGLMAVQYGRPALIVSGGWQDEPDGSASFEYRRLEFDESARTVNGTKVAERRNVREYVERIREGDLVVVDADEGVLRVFGQGQAALALHDSLRQLDAASRRLERATGPAEVLTERGRRLHALHQLEKLAGRIDEPALITHAVRELLTATPAGVPESGHCGRAHLLELFRDRPGQAAFVTDVIFRVACEVADRHAMARSEAVRLIPSATSPHEVLTLRLAVARLRHMLDQITEFLDATGIERPCGLTPDEGLVDACAAERLEAIHVTLLERVRQFGAVEPPPTGQVSLDEHIRTNRALGQLRLLAGVCTVSRGDRDEIARRRRELEAHHAARVADLRQRLVLWPEDGGLEIEALVGAKAANLAELRQLGGSDLVPAWFVVTDRAFQDVLASCAPRAPSAALPRGASSLTLGEAIDATVSRDNLTAGEKAAFIRQLWAEIPLPQALETEVIDAYRRLGSMGGTGGAQDGRDDSTAVDAGEPFVAIRSSAREEDTEAVTGAGEFDTFLFVRGTSEVLGHLRLAWSGLWTPRAIHDRAAYGREGRGQGGGVIVQRIAWSRVSGVLQTTNVAEGRTREMVINVGLGLGEGIVSGAVAADHVVVSKSEDPDVEPLRFRYVTSDKRERVIFDARAGSGTLRVGVLSHQRLRAALEYVELVELVRAATRLEAAYGYPLDIEFGFEGTQLRILQVRPVPGSLSVWRETLDRCPLRSTEAASAGQKRPS